MRKYGESKTTRIMMATVPHVTSGLGLRKFQADGFLLTRVYISVSRMSSSKQVAVAVIVLDECGVFGRNRKNRKRREMWAKKWLLGRDRFTHLNLLNLIAKVKPLIAKQDTVMRSAITTEARIAQNRYFTVLF